MSLPGYTAVTWATALSTAVAYQGLCPRHLCQRPCPRRQVVPSSPEQRGLP